MIAKAWKHLSDVWNLLDLLTLVLNAVVATRILTHADLATTIHLGAANTWLLWFRAVQFLSGFDSTARYVSMFLEISRDVVSFLVMIGIFLVANGCTAMLMFPNASTLVWYVRDPKGVREHAGTMPWALFSSFKMMLGDSRIAVVHLFYHCQELMLH
jgi:hypothetical protein